MAQSKKTWILCLEKFSSCRYLDALLNNDSSSKDLNFLELEQITTD